MAKQPSLLKDLDFMKFWTGQSISVFGSQFSGVAIPFVALYVLGAKPFQFGVLGALGTLAFLIFSLPIGTYVDRHRRRVIMVYSDFGRAFLLALIPLTAVVGFLSMNLLYFVALLSGVLTVFFEISYQSYIPSLVGVDKLVDANGKLETTRAISSGIGPPVAGVVVGLVTAPIAIVGDTFGYLVSAASLSWIRKAEAEIEKTTRSTFHDIREGIRVVTGDRRLWQIAGCTSTANLFGSGIFTIIIPYMASEFGFSALYVGAILGLGAVGSVVGAQLASRMAAKFGVGASIILSAFMFGIPTAGLYIATPGFAAIPISVSFFILSFASVAYNVNQVSYRQALVSRNLLGRMNATMRFIVSGTVPIGSFLGGVLAQLYGYREAIGICVLGASVSFLWVLFSPIRDVREMPKIEGSS